MASTAPEPAIFPYEEYTVSPGVKLSLPQMSFLLAVHPGFNLLRDLEPGDVVLIPDKQAILWNFLTLWVELLWQNYVDEYVQAVGDSARAFYKATETGPCGLDANLSPVEPYTIVAQAMQKLKEHLPSPMADVRRFIRPMVRQCDQACSTLEERGLVQDPIVFEAGVIAVATMGLGRGRYYRLSRNGKTIRREIVTGLLTYGGGQVSLAPKEGDKETVVTWNVPMKIAELLLRVNGTVEKVLRAVVDPDGKDLPSQRPPDQAPESFSAGDEEE